jgi:hypothetical protein
VISAHEDGRARTWCATREGLLRLLDARCRAFTPEERERYRDLLDDPAAAPR